MYDEYGWYSLNEKIVQRTKQERTSDIYTGWNIFKNFFMGKIYSDSWNLCLIFDHRVDFNFFLFQYSLGFNE